MSDWEVNGWRLRIEPGYKGPEDKRIGVAGPNGDFCVLSLAALGAVTRLWYDNEKRLYPPPARGGEYTLDFLRECCTSNLTTACQLYRLPSPDVKRLDRDTP